MNAYGAQMEWHWQGKTELLEDKPILSTTNPTQTCLELSPGLLAVTPASKYLNHGMAKYGMIPKDTWFTTEWLQATLKFSML
jgi:hypothetical protein